MTTVDETLVEFPFEPRTVSGTVVPYDRLNISVEGPQSVHAKAISRGNNYFISFITTTIGTYKIIITHNGENIVRSPVTVSVKAKETPDDEPQIPSESQEDLGPRKHTVKFQVDAKDSNGKILPPHSHFKADVAGPEHISDVDLQVEYDKLLISFETTVTTGEFSVSVKHNGEHIHRSPFTVTLSKAEDGERNRDNDIATLEPEDDSRTIQFKVPATLPDGSTVYAYQLHAVVEKGPGNSWEPKVQDDDGQLLVSFKTRTLGNYTVSVLMGSTHISGSPFDLQM
jgi:hypothetical protein